MHGPRIEKVNGHYKEITGAPTFGIKNLCRGAPVGQGQEREKFTGVGQQVGTERMPPSTCCLSPPLGLLRQWKRDHEVETAAGRYKEKRESAGPSCLYLCRALSS